MASAVGIEEEDARYSAGLFLDDADVLKAALEHVGQGICVVDAELRVLFHNARLLELLDLPAELFDSPSCFEEILRYNAKRGEYGPGDTDEAVATRLATARRFERYREERVRPNGRVIEVVGEPLPSGGFVATYADVTARNASLEALRESEARYRTIIDSEPECVKILDREGVLLDMNPAGLAMIEADSLAQVRGMCVYPLIAEESREPFRNLNERVFAGEQCELRFHICGLKGSRRLMETNAAPLRGADGEVIAHLAITRDVTEADRLARQVHYQATHDLLTALPNRHQFERRLAAAVSSARRGDASHVVCFIDLDQFKIVNDTCGHAAGDELLRRIGAVLRKSARAHDLLARLGGDEFVLLMENSDLESGMRAAEVIRARIEAFRFSWNGVPFGVAASIGLVVLDSDTLSVADVMSAADAACYAAKDSGRNRVRVYSPDDSLLTQRQGEMQWVTRLEQALADDRFELHLQPIIPLRPDPHACPRFEVLVRMVEGDGVLVMPEAFLPAAERYHLAARLDRQVVQRTLAWMTRPGATEADGHLSINLSAQSLGDDVLMALFDERLGADTALAKRLCLEITETAAITDLSRAHDFIERLSGLGCGIALDDFGSGLSSFAYLRSLPVDYVKIDGQFVKDIEVDPVDLAMVRSIHEIAHLMGKRTVAEFVESEAILSLLRTIGVDYAQGYAVGRPVPLALKH